MELAFMEAIGLPPAINVAATKPSFGELTEAEALSKFDELTEEQRATPDISPFTPPQFISTGSRPVGTLARAKIEKHTKSWSTAILDQELLQKLEPFCSYKADPKTPQCSFPVPALAMNSSTVDFAFELLLGAPAAVQPILGVPYRSASGDGRPPAPMDPVRKDGLKDFGRFAAGICQMPESLARFPKLGPDKEALMAESRVALGFLDRAVMVGGKPTFTYRSSNNIERTRALSSVIQLCLECAPSKVCMPTGAVP